MLLFFANVSFASNQNLVKQLERRVDELNHMLLSQTAALEECNADCDGLRSELARKNEQIVEHEVRCCAVTCFACTSLGQRCSGRVPISLPDHDDRQPYHSTMLSNCADCDAESHCSPTKNNEQQVVSLVWNVGKRCRVIHQVGTVAQRLSASTKNQQCCDKMN